MGFREEDSEKERLIRVIKIGLKVNKGARILIYGEWLPKMGFINGALVQALPETEGMVFRLCDENISKYSELDAVTKSQGGSLIQSGKSADREMLPCLTISGRCVADAGLRYGDELITMYEYGVIRVRKLTENTKIVRLFKYYKQLGFCGTAWLTKIGFVPDALVTAAIEQGLITLKLHEGGI